MELENPSKEHGLCEAASEIIREVPPQTRRLRGLPPSAMARRIALGRRIACQAGQRLLAKAYFFFLAFRALLAFMACLGVAAAFIAFMAAMARSKLRPESGRRGLSGWQTRLETK